MEQGECVDDGTILGTEILWRFVHPSQLTRDKLTGRVKPTSGAFRESSHKMSVDIASMTCLADARRRNPGKFTARFSVETVRGFGKSVTQKLDPDPDNPAHAIVCPKLTPTEARGLSDALNVWADPPADDSIPPSIQE